MNRGDFLSSSIVLATATGSLSLAPVKQVFPTGARVLFQGDSITDYGRDRSSEPNQAPGLGEGYPLLVAARGLLSDPREGLRFFNRGVSGNTVPDLQARWQTDTINIRPDILSILIGVNDFWHVKLGTYAGTAADYEKNYKALLDTTRRALPNVKIVVMEPFLWNLRRRTSCVAIGVPRAPRYCVACRRAGRRDVYSAARDVR